MITLLLSALLQISLPPVNPVANPMLPTPTVTVELHSTGPDWMLQTKVASGITIKSFEIDTARKNPTYPGVSVSGSRAAITAVGDRTACVYIEAPAGTKVVVVGKSDDDMLWTGSVVDGLIVSQGVPAKSLFPYHAYSALLSMAQFSHAQRLTMFNGKPTVAQIEGR